MPLDLTTPLPIFNFCEASTSFLTDTIASENYKQVLLDFAKAFSQELNTYFLSFEHILSEKNLYPDFGFSFEVGKVSNGSIVDPLLLKNPVWKQFSNFLNKGIEEGIFKKFAIDFLWIFFDFDTSCPSFLLPNFYIPLQADTCIQILAKQVQNFLGKEKLSERFSKKLIFYCQAPASCCLKVLYLVVLNM